jgi:ATP-dependent Clp protease ATP-binding subunit ClpA
MPAWHRSDSIGSESAGRKDGASILKPASARGEVRCISAMTFAEYRAGIRSGAGTALRGGVVPEPSRDEAVKILRGLRSEWEAHHTLFP